MARYIRKTVITLKLESTYGTDAVPSGSTDALLVSNLTINPLNAQNVKRENVRAFFGGSEELVGAAYVEMGFDLELQGAGAAGDVPAWGAALRAAGFGEAVTAGNRVDYTLVTDTIESATIYWYDDGVLHKGFGGRATYEIVAGVGERPVIRLKFLLLDGGISAASNPSATLTAWKTPKVITDNNTTSLNFGCTYSAGALSGGTEYTSRGLNLNGGNATSFTPLLGQETVDITDRDVTGSVELDLTAAQEVTFMGNVKSNTLQSIGFVHGSISGFKVLMFLPNAQLINPKKAEINGRRLIGYDVRALPSTSSGNDELRIVAL